MGNTSSANTQYAQAYASKRYESLVDQHTGQIVALQDRITGEIIPSIQKVADDLNVYINSNNGALVAIEDRITKQINGVASASETQIKQIVSDLATQGQTINSLQLAFDTYTKSTAPDAYASKTYEAVVTQQGQILRGYGVRLDGHDTKIANLEQSLSGQIVQAGKVSNDALSAYITLNDNMLVALKSEIDGSIATAAQLSSDQIQKVASDLAAEGIRITGVATTVDELKSQVTTIEANLLSLTNNFNQLKSDFINYQSSVDSSISGIQGNITGLRTDLSNFQANVNQFHDNTLKANYNFNKFNIGNGWFLQPQSDGSKDLLCIGKGDNTSICLNSSGDLDYSGSYGNYVPANL
jgi:hypothetical protein